MSLFAEFPILQDKTPCVSENGEMKILEHKLAQLGEQDILSAY